MFLTVLTISIVLIALAFIGLGINMLIKKNGKFPETGVGHNPHLKKQGIGCAKAEEIKSWKEARLAQNPAQAQAKANDYPGCAGCSCGD